MNSMKGKSLMDADEKEEWKDGNGINHCKWMEEFYSNIKDKDIWNIAIPGTHDSGIFSAANTIGVRTQSRNISEQLHDGIRMFDLRIRYAVGEYLMAHNNIYHISQKFFDAIKQIKDFLDANTKEVVIVTIWSENKESINGMTAERRRYVQERIIEILGNYLAPPGKSKISDLVNSNKRAIIISAYPESSGEFKNYFWNWNDSVIHSTYEDYQGASGNTIQWKADHLDASLPGIMAARTNYRGFYKVDLDLWSVNIDNSAKYFQHPLAMRFFSKNIVNCDKSIFIIDFYEKSGFADAVIRKNV